MLLKGICPVVPTLFTDGDVIDLLAVRNVTKFALDAGASGIVFPGVASEYNFLTPAERDELLAVVADEVAGKVPIIGGASASNSAESLVAGQQAIAHGISHLMIMAPACLGHDIDAQLAFFAEISDGLSDVEIILQNAPVPVGAALNVDQIARIVRENPMVTYIKEETLPSGPVITALGEMRIPQLKGILGGGGARYIIDELTRGAVGALPAVELTDLHVAIYNAHQAGDTSLARQLYRDSLPLLVSQTIYRMRLTKYALKTRGIADNLHVRAPLPEMDQHARQDVDSMIADLNSRLMDLPNGSSVSHG